MQPGRPFFFFFIEFWQFQVGISPRNRKSSTLSIVDCSLSNVLFQNFAEILKVI